MHEMSLENLEAVTGGIVVSRAKEIYKYLSDEDKKKVEEMEKEMLEKMNKLSQIVTDLPLVLKYGSFMS